MATTLDLRRRIRSAQNISKTTRAMQMIAASKLRRAQEAAVASRPYVTELMALSKSLAPKDAKADTLHPYMVSKKATGKTLYVFIGPDKGLCGGLITNLIRELLKVRHENASFVTVGKKLENVGASTKNLIASFPFGTTLPKFGQVLPIVDIINEQFLGGKVDTVKIISTKFQSVFSQTPQLIDLLPVKLETSEDIKELDVLFEPSKEALLPALLKRYLEMTVYQSFLESYASYNAAQMIAMQNATNNAKDIVNELQLLYNKARQEKITKEILDISSASVALGSL